MTNFERLEPHIEKLFGPDWTVNDFARIYEDAMIAWDCSGCIVGEDNCTRRMGMIPFSECKTEEEKEAWEDGNEGNGKCCIDILIEWLNEESES